MCLISVITPTFRREDFLQRCAESVLSQDVDADIELIVVNDAGEDLKPAAWMQDSRAKVVTTNRIERALVRNTGAALSRGEYLYFLDDDDYVLPGAFHALLATAQANPEAVHVYGAYEVFDEATQQITPVRPAVEGFLFPLLMSGAMIPLQASWIRRDAFLKSGGYPARFVPADDAYFLHHVCRLGPTAYTDTLVTRIRVNHNNPVTLNAQREHMRWMPEHWTSMADTFRLVRGQTRGRPGWAGGCVRVYLKAAARALQRGSAAIMLSRLCLAGRLALPNAGKKAFWNGLRGHS